MDLGLLVILFIIGNFILNSKKNKRRNEEHDNTYDEQETYQSDESNTDRRSNRSWKDRLEAELGVKKKGPARSWEEMEREYGIRIESKEAKQPGYASQPARQEPYSHGQDTYSRKSQVPVESSETPVRAAGQYGTSMAEQHETSTANQYGTGTAQYEKSAAQLYVEQQKKGVHSHTTPVTTDSRAVNEYAQKRTHSRYMHIPGTHGRGKLPPGGLKAGIRWAIILQKPKALQRQR